MLSSHVRSKMMSNSTARRLEIQRGICPTCAPHGGHAPGQCPGDKRDGPQRKPCKCRVESRPGKSQFIVRGLNKTYFQQATGIGPMFGGTREQAYRFADQIELREEMARWPMTAEVGCTVESVLPAPRIVKVTGTIHVRAESKPAKTPRFTRVEGTSLVTEGPGIKPPSKTKIAPVPDEPKATPFLKWAGGKRGLVPEILKVVPARFGTYYEPFVGGGALFFELVPKHAVIGDANAKLIDAFKGVAKDVEAVIRVLSKFPDTPEFFTATRKKLNSVVVYDIVEHAARVIYLNKTCFNGLWRENRKGEFNVPYDAQRQGKRTICDASNLRAVARALRGHELVAGDFEKVAMRACKGDFVYFDPPYVPVGGYSNFTQYEKGGFGPEEQARLVTTAKSLKARGVHVLLSNADVPEVRRLYKGFKLIEVQARRSINSKTTKRGKVGELLIL